MLIIVRLDIKQQTKWFQQAEADATQSKIQYLCNALTPFLARLLQAVAGVASASTSPTQVDEVMINWEKMSETVNEETSTTPCSGCMSTGLGLWTYQPLRQWNFSVCICHPMVMCHHPQPMSSSHFARIKLKHTSASYMISLLTTHFNILMWSMWHHARTS